MSRTLCDPFDKLIVSDMNVNDNGNQDACGKCEDGDLQLQSEEECASEKLLKAVNYDTSCRRRLFFDGKKAYRKYLIKKLYLNTDECHHVDFNSITDPHTRLCLKYHIHTVDDLHSSEYSPFSRRRSELAELLRLLKYTTAIYRQNHLKRQQALQSSPYVGDVSRASVKNSGKYLYEILELEYLLSLSFPPCLEDYRRNCIHLLEELMQ